MLNLNYLKRLGLHGGRLVWRVMAILVPVVGGALWNALRETFARQAEQREPESEYGVFADGTPWVENVEHEQWEAYYGKDVHRI